MMRDIPILLRLASLEDDLRQSKYAPFSEDPRDVVKDAHETIRQLRIEVKKAKAQLASRNQAAEAMGVLERLVNGDQFVRLNKIGDRNDARGHCICAVVRGSKSGDETFGEANSLIEAVLKAGGGEQ